MTSLALLALCASIGTAAGAGDRGAPPSSGSSATATSDVEQARAAARAHAIARQLPAAETAALAGPPLAVHPMRLANGDHGTRYEWLGSGKGGGWHLHVIVNDRTGATDVVSGFERE